MRKLFLLVLVLLAVQFSGIAQQYTNSTLWGNGFNRLRIIAADTVGTKISGSLTVIGGTLYIADGTKWSQVSGGTSNLRFTSNVVVNGGTGTKVGIWNEGETIPLAGKLYDSLPYILATKCNHPSYVTPTATISASPSSGSYERGTNLGTITLTAGGSIGNGGAYTTNTFYQNASPLGGNTTTVSSLTSTQTFYVNRAYTQGAIINDNCGNPDATGRINAGSANSSSISFTAFDKRYWGYSTSSPPSNSEVLAVAGGSTDNTVSKGKGAFVITVTGTNKYVFYTYPASYGDLSSITISGLESIGAFTKTVGNVTNAQGFAVSYNIYTSNNQFTNTTISFNSVN